MSGEDPGLEFGVLGPLVVTRSGVPLALGGRQQRAVLALLLIEHDAMVSVGRLGDALWGGRPPPSFVRTLQTYVFHLREALEPDRARGADPQVLVTEPGGYRLRTAGRLDAALFRGLVRSGQDLLAAGEYGPAVAELEPALALWRGDVLADLAELDFVEQFATGLAELRLAAIEAHVDAELALGRHAAVVAELDPLVAEHSLREQLHARRMLALYRCGRQSEALAAYRGLRTLLDDELGIEPSPPLQDLHRAVLAQDPDLAWRPIGPSLDGHDGTGAADPPGDPDVEVQRAVSSLPAMSQPTSWVDRHSGGRRWRVGVAALLVAVTVISATVWAVRRSSRVSLAALPANSVGALLGDGSLEDAVTVGAGPTALAFGAGSLWSANASAGTVSRIDPTNHSVVPIPVGSAPTALTVTGRDVWVANGGSGSVSRINADTDSVTERVEVGSLPLAIAAGPSGVWVANSGDGTVQRIDPATGTAGPAIGVGLNPDGIAVGAHTVWVANGGDGTVSPVDASTGRVSSPIGVGAGPKGIAVSADGVWVANSLEQSVMLIDPDTDRVIATVRVGDGPSTVAVSPGNGGRIWVGDEYDGTVAQFDLRHARDVRRIALGSSPRSLALVGKRLWIASGAFTAASHKGGALVVDTTFLPGTFNADPATGYDSLTVREERLVYDGLVAARMSGGLAGLTLVPDLATALPRPTDGGTTYTFTVRRGIRYSTGKEVHASDFARGLRRALTLTGGNPDYYFGGVVGGHNCFVHPRSCDLSRGIITDDPTGRVVFRLTAPDPDFLYKLTFFVMPAPPGTPTTEVTAPVLPGTGPYMVTGYGVHDTKHATQLVLVRNPYFRQWSFAAQPAGYPDVIRFRAVRQARDQIADALSGRADVATGGNFDPTRPSPYEATAVRYPTLVNQVVTFNTEWMPLNTRTKPFDNVLVRRAINYAVDRHRLVDLSGGSFFQAVTCQLIPPGFPSYRPYCPFTTAPHDGHYHGPDLTTAQKLVARSGTSGMTITVIGQVPPRDRVSEYFASVLRALHYRVTYRTEEDPDYVADPRHRFQIGQPQGWLADFPAPANFYDALLACKSFVPTGVGYNVSEFCNPRIDALAREAKATQIADPARARNLWAEVDRQVTDEAPWVVMTNIKESSLISARVHNYQSTPIFGPLLDQLWIR